METQIFTSSVIPSKHDQDCNLFIINTLHSAQRKLKNWSSIGLFIFSLIYLPSFLNVFSPNSNWSASVYAQVPNAVFDANDPNKGILIPRVSLLSTTDIVTVPLPSISLLLYNTSTVGIPPNNLTTGFYFWNGIKWQPIGGTSTFSPTFVEFYALMPSNNVATIAAGSPVGFPQNGPTSGHVTRSTVTPVSQFVLPEIGTYSINWQVSIAEPGQLVLKVNGVEDARTVVGRATGTSQIVGNTLLTTSTINTVVSVNNPSGNPIALTVSPISGGTHAVSASIIIKRLQ